MKTPSTHSGFSEVDFLSWLFHTALFFKNGKQGNHHKWKHFVLNSCVRKMIVSYEDWIYYTEGYWGYGDNGGELA